MSEKKDFADHYFFNDNWGDLTVSSNKCFRIIDGKTVTEEDDKRSDLDHVLESVEERQKEVEKEVTKRKEQILYVNKVCDSEVCQELDEIVSEFTSMDPKEFWLKAIGYRCTRFKSVSYLWNQRYGMNCSIPPIRIWYEPTNMSAKRAAIKKMVKCLEEIDETRNKDKA